MKILMVCLGNICRSPMAEGILRNKLEGKDLRVTVDSAGTGGWHVGEHPDKSAIDIAKKFGVDISELVARQFVSEDFGEFDRIFVMDKSNYLDVTSMAESEPHKQKVELLLNLLHPGNNEDVPDPWYGNADGFSRVFKLIEQAINVLVMQLEKEN